MPLTFLSPWYLLLFPLAAVGLIYAYKLKQNAARISFGSTYFLSKIVVTPKKSRLKIPLRFLLELLVVAILCLVVAGVQMHKEGSSILIVVDTSLSMSRQVNASSDIQYIEAIKERISKDIQDNLGASFYLAEWDNSFRLNTTQLLGKRDLIQRVEKITTSYSPNNIKALQQISDIPASSIYFYTDMDLEIYSELIPSGQIRVINIEPNKSQQPNMALQLVSVEDDTCKIIAHNYGESTVAAELEIYSISNDSDLVLKEKRMMNVPANGIVEFDYESNEPIGFQLKVDAREDALRYDNYAFCSAISVLEKNLFVSPDELTRQQVRDLLGGEFSVISPKEFELMSAEQKIRGIILHRVDYASVPAKRIASLSPGTGKILLTGISAEKVQDAQITSYQNFHSLIRYLELTGVTLREALVFNPEQQDETLLMSDKGALAIERVSDGVEILHFGVELFPLDANKSPLSSIMFLNLVSWVKEASNTSFANQERSTDSLITFKPLESLSFFPGLYKATEEEVRSINYFYESESRLEISETNVNLIPHTNSTENINNRYGSSSLHMWLILIAIVLILAEFFHLTVLKKNSES